jgi:hypothetical protein
MKCHWISPYRKDKDLGKGINEAIEQLNAPDEDWIIHCDYDVMWLLPESKGDFIDVLENTEYDILGCMTNRLGLIEQRVVGMEKEDSLSAHINIAAWKRRKKSAVLNAPRGIAAMVMAFKVSTWKTLGGFYEEMFNCDLMFCQGAMRMGMKIGIASHIYVLHRYRFTAEELQPQPVYYFER